MLTVLVLLDNPLVKKIEPENLKVIDCIGRGASGNQQCLFDGFVYFQ